MEEGVREMNRCPDCKNSFLRQFVCTTCGAEKLYDATVETLRNQLAAAQKDAERYRWLRDDKRGRSLSVSSLAFDAELSDAAVDAAMKECGRKTHEK